MYAHIKDTNLLRCAYHSAWIGFLQSIRQEQEENIQISNIDLSQTNLYDTSTMNEWTKWLMHYSQILINFCLI